MSGSKQGISYQPRLDELISLNEAAKISGLSPDHLRRIVRDGELWGIRIGRNWATTVEAVREYLARDRKPGPKPKKAPGKKS
ncbi:MAG: helix-turn-helix domain-containing protein [Anaerolineales bacterium]|nr:helix-turn-helix domain-containing protein [Anaerolineales bacterium]